MTTVVMEYVYDAPLGEAEAAAWIAKLRRCLEVREVEWQHAYLSFDRKTMVCVYQASDAGMLQMVHGMINVPFVRCTPVTDLVSLL